MNGFSKVNNKVRLLNGINRCLIVIVIVYSLLLLTLYINNKITVNSIIGSSPFVGSLLGALITGLLAIFVSNLEQRRLRKKDKEKSEKNYKLVSHYLSLMLYEFNKIIKEWDRVNALPETFEVEEHEDGGYSFIQLVSPDEERYIQKQKDQINERISISSSEIITYSTHLFEVKVNDLESDILDEYLKKIKEIRTYVMPIMKDLHDNGASILSEDEIKKLKKIFSTN